MTGVVFLITRELEEDVGVAKLPVRGRLADNGEEIVDIVVEPAEEFWSRCLDVGAVLMLIDLREEGEPPVLGVRGVLPP